MNREKSTLDRSRRNRARTLRRQVTALTTAAAAITLGLSGTRAHAKNWTGAVSALWDTSGNWSPVNEPGTGDTAVFPASIPGTGAIITLTAGENALSLDFNNNYFLNSGSLAIAGTGGPVTVGGGSLATINTTLTGSTGLTKNGSGELVLGGPNTFLGAISVAGILTIGTDNNLGNAANTVLLQGGTLKTHNAATISTSRAITIGALGGRIDSNGTLTLNAGFAAGSGSNPLTVGGTGTLVLTNTTTRSGNTYIQSGTVRLTNGAALGTGGDIISGTGALEIAAGINHTNIIFLDTGATLKSGGVGAVHGGTVFVQASGGNSVFLSGGANSGDTLQLGGPASNTYTGGTGAKTVINGLGRVTILTASNDYAGDWQIDSGTLRTIGVQSLGSGTSPVVINNTGTLQLASVTFSRDVTLNNGSTLAFETGGQSYGTHTVANNAATTLTIKSGGTEILGTLAGGGGTSSMALTADTAGSVMQLNNSSTYTGALSIGSNLNVQIDADDSLGNAANPLSINGGRLSIAAFTNFSTSRPITIGAATGEISIGSTTQATFNGAITGGANTLNLFGTGTMILTASSSRFGPTVINQLNTRITHGSALGSGTPTINGFGTLELFGVTYNPDIDFQNTATLRGAGGTSTYAGIMTLPAASSGTISTSTSGDTLIINRSSPIIVPATSTVRFDSDANGTVQLENANTQFLGTAQIDGGIVRINNAAAFSSNITPAVVINAGTLELATGNFPKDINFNNGSTLRGVGNVFASRTFTVANSASVTLAAGPLSTDVLNIAQSGQTITGGSGAQIHITGPGTVFSNQPATYTGGWIVDSGTLRISSTATGTGVSSMFINSGGTLHLETSFTRGITLNGGTLFAPNSTTLTTSGGLSLASTGTSTVNVSSGSTLTQTGAITGIGTLNKIGSGTLQITNASNGIGNSLVVDNGTVLQSAGTTSIPNTLRTGNVFGQTGNYNLTGGDLTAIAARIGEIGTGTFTQSAGTSFTVSGHVNPMQIGVGSTGVGTYTLNGGSLNVVNSTLGANGEAVGTNGTGTFQHNSGTHTVSGANGNLVIAYGPNSVGTYNMVAGNLTVNSLYLGRDNGANATLTQTGGTISVATEFLDIGLIVGSTGTVNANAGTLTAQGIYVGGISTQPRGTGNLNIGGGTVTSNGETRVWDTTGSGITLTLGTLSTSSLSTSGNPSRFTWNLGTLAITGVGGFNVGSSGPLGATLPVGVGKTLNVTKTTTIDAGGLLTIGGSFNSGSLAGAGTLTINSTAAIGSDNASTTFSGNLNGTGNLTKVGSGTQTVAHVRTNTLAVQLNATMLIATGGGNNGTSRLSALPTVSGAAHFDLNDARLIVQFGTNPSPLAATRTSIRNGRGGTDFANAPWNGAAGISSLAASAAGGGDGVSFAVGYVENCFLPSLGLPSYTSFGGQTVDSGSMLIRYTRGADANLDGRVNTDDVTIVGALYNAPGTGHWFLGDFDFDGLCDSDDVTVLGALYDATAPPLSAAQLTAQFGSDFAAAFARGQSLGSSVPEPAAPVVFLGLAPLLAGRRRRRA